AAIDRQLADLAALADPMLPLTPVDTASAWHQFETAVYERAPELHLRPLTVDPEVLKRMLHALPIEAVDDPALGALFQDKRHELDAQLDLLLRRGREAFLPSSLVLHPGPDDELVALARRMLRAVTPDDHTRSTTAS